MKCQLVNIWHIRHERENKNKNVMTLIITSWLLPPLSYEAKSYNDRWFRWFSTSFWLYAQWNVLWEYTFFNGAHGCSRWPLTSNISPVISVQLTPTCAPSHYFWLPLDLKSFYAMFIAIYEQKWIQVELDTFWPWLHVVFQSWLPLILLFVSQNCYLSSVCMRSSEEKAEATPSSTAADYRSLSLSLAC